MADSAGIVVYRPGSRGPEILLVHPGGPFWAGKDDHAWSIPKGEYDPDAEDAETAATREFAEELGHRPPDGDRIELPAFRAGKKRIRAWLIAGDLDPDTIESNSFELEWPPRSGQMQRFPEVDRAAWFDLDEAETRLHKGQRPLVELVRRALADP
ncbi:MAG: NUDIX domain-containing protein [Actinomycetota bacterium]